MTIVRATGVVLSLLAMASAAKSATPAIDSQADAILKHMSAYVAGAKTLSFKAHAVSEQFTSDGLRVESARNEKVLIRRPDHAAATVVGDQDNFHFYYDGAHATLFNPSDNKYASIDAPPTIDATMDLLANKYGMTVPLADLLFSDPYKILTEKLQSARYIGQDYVFDARYDHLACSQDTVDWQIWIATGDKPLPRKLTITYKLLPGQPHFTAYFSNWNLSPTRQTPNLLFHPQKTRKRLNGLAPPLSQIPIHPPPRLKNECYNSATEQAL